MFSLRLAVKVNSSKNRLPKVCLFCTGPFQYSSLNPIRSQWSLQSLVRMQNITRAVSYSGVIQEAVCLYFREWFHGYHADGWGVGRVVSTCKTNNEQFLIQNHSDLEFWFLCSHWIYWVSQLTERILSGQSNQDLFVWAPRDRKNCSINQKKGRT